jgi:hypothetical protein
MELALVRATGAEVVLSVTTDIQQVTSSTDSPASSEPASPPSIELMQGSGTGRIHVQLDHLIPEQARMFTRTASVEEIDGRPVRVEVAAGAQLRRRPR